MWKQPSLYSGHSIHVYVLSLSLSPSIFPSSQEWEKCGVQQHWFETVDFQPPSLTCIHQGLEIIDQVKSSGKSVYVHCKAGKGRSAVVTTCYLIKVCYTLQYTCICMYEYMYILSL